MMRRSMDMNWEEYAMKLETAGITPEDEIRNLLEEIKDRDDDFYNEYRQRLETILENWETLGDIQEDGEYTCFDDYYEKTVFMPSDRITELESRYKDIYIERDGTIRLKQGELPEDVKEERGLLEWCCNETVTAMKRDKRRWKVYG